MHGATDFTLVEFDIVFLHMFFICFPSGIFGRNFSCIVIFLCNRISYFFCLLCCPAWCFRYFSQDTFSFTFWFRDFSNILFAGKRFVVRSPGIIKIQRRPLGVFLFFDFLGISQYDPDIKGTMRCRDNFDSDVPGKMGFFIFLVI